MTTRERFPFFLASAVSMLAGCWAIEHGLQLRPGQLRGLVVLAGVLQLYEAVLLGLSIVLSQRGLDRQGRQLLAIEAAFLLDVSLAHVEIATQHAYVGLAVTSVLLALAVIKWNVLLLSLGLKVPAPLGRLAAVEMAAALYTPVAFAALAQARRLDGSAVYTAAWLLALLPVAHWIVRDRGATAPLERTVRSALAVGPPAAFAAHVVAVGWVHDLAPWPALVSPVLLGVAARTVLAHGVVPRLPVLAVLVSLAAPDELSATVLGVTLTPWRLALVGAAAVWQLAAMRVDRLAAVLVVSSLVTALAGASPAQMVENTERAYGAGAATGPLGWGWLAVAAAFVLLGVGGARALRQPLEQRRQQPDDSLRFLWPAPPLRRRLVEALIAGACGLTFVSIAVPSHLRARVSANEAGTIGWMRTVVSAEAQWASTHGGLFTTLECLQEPRACDPGSPGVPYLPAPMSTGRYAGYERRFHAPPSADAAKLASYTLSAVPATRQSGVRSFVATSEGRICAVLDGSVPRDAETGAIGPECHDLS